MRITLYILITCIQPHNSNKCYTVNFIRTKHNDNKAHKTILEEDRTLRAHFINLETQANNLNKPLSLANLSDRHGLLSTDYTAS